jgi:hypothetical protein
MCTTLARRLLLRPSMSDLKQRWRDLTGAGR